MALVFDVADLDAADVRALIGRHLAFAGEHSPPDHVHAMDVDRLVHPAITVFEARRHGTLVGVGAIKEVDPTHGELKSMHVAVEARGTGVGAAILSHLLAVARERGYRRVSLETGTMEAFAAARSLYERAGFTPCEPFGDYTVNPYSTCMTLELSAPPLP